MKQFPTRRSDGPELDVLRGIDTPVPGLALCQCPCDCGITMYGLVHVRSGQALFFSHHAESFGLTWPILNRADWTRSATELEGDAWAALAWTEAFHLLPDGFTGEPAEDISDLPGQEENQ